VSYFTCEPWGEWSSVIFILGIEWSMLSRIALLIVFQITSTSIEFEDISKSELVKKECNKSMSIMEKLNAYQDLGLL